VGFERGGEINKLQWTMDNKPRTRTASALLVLLHFMHVLYERAPSIARTNPLDKG
jgi:hypothetical protein